MTFSKFRKAGFFRHSHKSVSYTHLIIGLVVNTISALSVKELPEEELNEGEVKNDNEKYGMVQAFKPVSYTHLSRGMSVSWFIRNFKKYTGSTPMQFIVGIRINNAQMLLETKMCIRDRCCTIL